jgi:hypothetical protein
MTESETSPDTTPTKTEKPALATPEKASLGYTDSGDDKKMLVINGETREPIEITDDTSDDDCGFGWHAFWASVGSFLFRMVMVMLVAFLCWYHATKTEGVKGILEVQAFALDYLIYRLAITILNQEFWKGVLLHIVVDPLPSRFEPPPASRRKRRRRKFRARVKQYHLIHRS